jgi:hypothetical protein
MDDSTMLNREAEPFATYFQRWYGKNPKVDAEIKAEFEGDLLALSPDDRDDFLHDLEIVLDKYPTTTRRYETVIHLATRS